MAGPLTDPSIPSIHLSFTLRGVGLAQQLERAAVRPPGGQLRKVPPLRECNGPILSFLFVLLFGCRLD